MKWGALLGVTVVAVLIVLYEWPKIGREGKREKGALVILTALGWGLSALLLFYPDMPGPTQLVDAIFHPLGQMLEGG